MLNTDSLFHYTSVDTLALILSSRKIRFNRLDQVDDMSEAKSLDLDAYRYLFVSCWTRDPYENLALWNMYTPNMSGVRLQVNGELFNKYEHPGELGGLKLPSDPYYSPIPPDEIFGEGYWIMPAIPTVFPQDIIYTDDHELLFPTIKVSGQGKTTWNQHLIGKYKRNAWKFQEETRFRVQVYPTEGNIRSLVENAYTPGSAEKIQDRLHRLMELNTTPPITNIFLHLADDALASLSILKGPKCSHADGVIIESLVEKYCPDAKVLESEFTGSIR